MFDVRMYPRFAALWAIIAVMLVPAGFAGNSMAQPPVNPKLPTLWIIGDSTVRNGQDKGDNSQWGWGYPLSQLFDLTKLNVQNHALGGTSSRSFVTRGLWDKVLADMKPGDYLIMQFGHNDPGAINDATRARGSIRGNGEETQEIDNLLTKQHETVHTYGWYLRKIIADAKAKGAKQVIVCSPIPRNHWTHDKVDRNTGYTQWAAEAARQAGADFINLNEAIAVRYDAEGEQKVTETYFPEKETTHTDWAGAVLNARTVIQLLKGLPKCDLAADLLPKPPELAQPR